MSDNKVVAPELSVLRERHSSKWRRFASDVLPMHVAEMDFQIAEPIAARSIKMTTENDLGYLGPVPEVGEAFAGFAARRWNWQIHPEFLHLATDVGVATVEFLRTHLKPGERVIINQPVYNGFHHWLEELEIEPLDVPLITGDHEYLLDLDGIEKAFAEGNRFLLLCNPHNPVGRAFSCEELTALAALARKYNAIVISDEIHAPLTYGEFAPYLACGEDAALTGVCITSSSKSWNLAGLKVAFLLAQSPEMNEKLKQLPEAMHWRSSIVGAFAMAEAFANGETWLDSTLETLWENALHLKSELARLLPSVKMHLPEAGYLAWLDISELGLTNEEIFTKAKVALVPGPDMGGAAYENFARFNFATSKELITEALERIQRAL
jgi:cysteine-S-conjugate beta-lyase